MSGEVLALVNYYARAGYYSHLQTVCNEVLKKRGSTDPTLVFWRALGMLKEGKVNDAIRDYEGIKSRGDLQLALPAKLALIHAHQMSKVVDGEEVHRLQSEVSMDEQNAPDRARLTAALLLWHLGELDEAQTQVTRLLQMQPQYVPALTLMGWLELQAVESDEGHMLGMDPEQSLARAETAFEDALAALALVGKESACSCSRAAPPLTALRRALACHVPCHTLRPAGARAPAQEATQAGAGGAQPGHRALRLVPPRARREVLSAHRDGRLGPGEA
eukprot:scaffold16501_cov72-Phaeocystis_antarctica.AAC.2